MMNTINADNIIRKTVRETILKTVNETLGKSYTGRLGNEFGRYQDAKANSFWDKIEELGFKHKLTAAEYDGKWNWKMRYYTIDKALMTNEVMQKLQQYLNFYNFVIIKKEEFEHTYKFCFEAKYGTEVKCADTYYHATPTEKVNKIMKVGLTPRDEGKRGEFRTPRVYLSPWYDDGLFSALYAEEGCFSSDRDYTVLKIDLSGMNPKPRVYRDEFATEQNCVYTYDNIPPQCLSIPPQKRKIEQAEENRVEKMFADSIGPKYGLETGKTIIKGMFEVPNKGYSVEVEIRFHMQDGVVYYPGDWAVRGFKKRFINTPKGKKYSNTYSFGKGYASPNYNGRYGKAKPIETAVKDLDKWLGNEFKPSRKSTQKVETIIREAVHKTLSEWINEVRYIDTRSEKYNGKINKKHWTDIYNQEPITDDSRIRVFHGCELKTACDIAINGTSGKEYHGRQYSYEAGMNPLGIFVTTDFETAKKFGVSNRGMAIIEFTAKGSDLESPVWNGQGSYFGQGSNPMPFDNAEQRNAQKMQYRQDALNTKDDYYYDGNKRRDISMSHVRNSDKPEMADRIFNNSEHQALFMGDLNPNMIKRIWVNLPREDGYVHTTDSYQPMSVRQFLKQFKDKEWQDGYDYKGQPIYTKIIKQKLFNPNDDVKSFDDLVDAVMNQDRKFFKSREQVIKNLNDMGLTDKEPSKWAIDSISHMLWPKQIIQLYGQDFFNKYFNRLGQ